jgi:hypothetical protein
MSTEKFASLSMQNGFSFNCPIFNAEVQFRSCVILRDRVYGGKSVQTRRGCQACIRSSKCPAAEVVRRIALDTSDKTDHCSSVEQKVGKLPADVLERIAPVVVYEQHLNELDVSLEERRLIETANARIHAQIQTAPREKVEPKKIHAASATTPRRKSISDTVSAAPQPKPKAQIHHAAQTGDMSAALNAA